MRKDRLKPENGNTDLEKYLPSVELFIFASFEPHFQEEQLMEQNLTETETRVDQTWVTVRNTEALTLVYIQSRKKNVPTPETISFRIN